MSRENVIDLGLNDAYNDLFSTQEERDNAQRSYVIDLAPEQIGDFPNHPFHVRMDESMMELAESVKQYGVLVPSLVRPLPDGGYQMVSGHRRKRAAELAALPVLPCIVRDLTDDEAVIIMVDSNLQRERVLPSEKAFAYKMKLDAMKRQGQRTDLTSVPLGPKLRSNKELSEQSPDGVTQIKRYIRLTNLIPELLDTVDRYCRSTVSRLMVLTSVTSSADSSILAGTRWTPDGWCRMPSLGAMGCSAMIFSIRVESVGDNSSGCDQPNICVRLPCASASISRTFLPCRERPMPRLAAVVVLPTPPF